MVHKMNAMIKSKTDQPKNHSHKSKKQKTQNDGAVRSLLFKIVSVFVIGYITKKMNNRKK